MSCARLGGWVGYRVVSECRGSDALKIKVTIDSLASDPTSASSPECCVPAACRAAATVMCMDTIATLKTRRSALPRCGGGAALDSAP